MALGGDVFNTLARLFAQTYLTGFCILALLRRQPRFTVLPELTLTPNVLSVQVHFH